MAIEIVTHRQDGGAEVWDTDNNHGGTVLGVDVQFLKNMDGSINRNFIAMACPVCGATSTHPVGGGSNPPANQMQFARLWQMRAQELGIPPAQRGWESIKAMVCAAVWEMDGEGRTCYILDTTGPDDIPPSGPR